jgi:hypothetical protein
MNFRDIFDLVGDLRLYKALMIVCTLALLIQPMRAQSTYASVVGVVNDGKNAVIPDARVKLVEVQTNITRTVDTKGDGAYEFVNLTQGRYRVEVEKTGFQKYT